MIRGNEQMACNEEGRILGLAHIGVRVSDMEASLRFYTEILGFELTHRQKLGTTELAFLNIGTCLLELIHPANYQPRDVETDGTEAAPVATPTVNETPAPQPAPAPATTVQGTATGGVVTPF